MTQIEIIVIKYRAKEFTIGISIKVLQGANEIGGTCIQVSTLHTTILLDIGLPLSDTERSDPDLPGKIDAVLVSHYHKDHWGLADLLDEATPLYLPGKAKEILLLQQKLINREKSEFLEEAISFLPGETLQIGDFTIKTYLVDHSAMDACGFEIEAEGERLVYTGDFRSHGRKGVLWQRNLNKISRPVNYLITEGTTLSRDDFRVPTETDLEEKAVNALKEHTGALALGWCSSVNYDRLTTFYRAAKRSGRQLAVDIFTAYMMSIACENTKLPDPIGFKDIRVYYPPALSRMIVESCGKEMLYPYKSKKLTREEVNEQPGKYLILARPSCRTRWLDQLEHWDKSILFYSQWSGYRRLKKNEYFLKWLYTKGCRDYTLHTSGHADPETIRRTIEALCPKELIPVHTENPGWFDNKQGDMNGYN